MFFWIKFCALLFQTSVPCDKPEIINKSENDLGNVSLNICLTKGVPNSGNPKAPLSSGIYLCSSLSALSVENREITFLSLKGILYKLNLDKSFIIFKAWGSTCPSISSFKIVSWIEWKSKWVVFHAASTLPAGYWTGVKS